MTTNNQSEMLLLNNTTCLDGSIASAFTCPICLDFYKSPVMLSNCGHTLCSECASKLKANDQGRVECPECRTESCIKKSAPLNISVKKSVEALANDENPMPIGVKCPHIGAFTNAKQICPHCENAFCSLCIVAHLERLKLNMKWLQSSFNSRTEKAMKNLDASELKAREIICEQIDQARNLAEKEMEAIIEWAKQRKEQWFLSLEKLENDEKTQIDMSVEDFKRIPAENDSLNDSVAETVGNSILLSSVENIAKLNKSVVSLDQKIFSLEEFERTSPSFNCNFDFEEFKSSYQKLEPKLELKKSDFAAYGCGSKSTEVLRFNRAVENRSVEEHFSEYAGISTTVASFAVNKEDETGRTALFAIAEKGSAEMARYLTETYCANMYHQDKTGHKDLPAHVAARHNNSEVLKYFVEKDSSFLSVQNGESSTPLLIAAASGSLEVVKFLCEQKNIESEQKNLEGFTPLMLAVKRNDVDMVRYFVETAKCGVGVKLPSTNDNVLHIAVKNRSVEVLKYLAKRFPALCEEANSADLQPIDAAISLNYLTEFEAFVESDSDLFQRNENESFLVHFAAELGSVDIGRYLLESHKIDSCVIRYKRAPIHSAVLENRLEFARMLLNFKPEMTELKTKKPPFLTPIEIAKQLGFSEMEDLLLTFSKVNSS